jgi:hypothetical protein
MFFVIKWKEGPLVVESRAAADCALGLFESLGRTNISARRVPFFPCRSIR